MDPFIIVEPGGHLYPRLEMADVARVVETSARGGIVEDLLYRTSERSIPCISRAEIPFFKKQTRTLLGANLHIDPIRIIDYIVHGGYGALERVLSHPDPEWIIEEVKTAGLRGRGGAGFPTGKKWELARKVSGGAGDKFLICNADEGDPGAYMDRSLLEGNPHSILEGMAIAGIAIGARKGLVYVRSEYPLAIKHTTIAIRQARDHGLLGRDILGTGLDFDVEIVRGAGAFVCGEETALIRSIEGQMGEPRQRPPYPIQRGLFGTPTCINNVETLANVPVIISKGAEAYAKVGIPENRGTKIFSLVGKVKNTGLVEVPLGTKIREVVYDIGGGPVGDSKVKAIQTGGPSGGCIPAEMFDLSIDYDSLAEAGSIMGSGGMIVMDESTCMVDVAKYFVAFLRDESCGKCFTCRKGTQRMWEILDDATRGVGSEASIDLLEELALTIRDSTMCGLGQSAPNPVLSTLRYFRDEYVEHVVHKRCRAGLCSDLVGTACQAACPLGTEAWRYIAHIERGELEDAYRVIRKTNPLPSVCARVCNHPCETACRAGASGSSPVAIRNLKRFVTDTTHPAVALETAAPEAPLDAPKVAVVGAGPAGLSATHALSNLGYRITLFESAYSPGGMLRAGIPEFRLPREVLEREIEALIDTNVTLRCGVALGRDITLDDLLEKEGYAAVFVAAGAHESRRLGLEGEDAEGVIPAMRFLEAYNLEGRSMARGRVAVIGGGNSAVDAARVALRLSEVTDVTLVYRRTREEMPAYEEEIDAALAEGVHVEALLSPNKILRLDGRISALQCMRNELGDFDSSGRRRPVPVEGDTRTFEIDTLVVAIGESSSICGVDREGVLTTGRGGVEVDEHTLVTSRAGVFAGGDMVTGSNTVVNALAAGRRAATAIDRFIRNEAMIQPGKPTVPTTYIEPSPDQGIDATRAAAPTIEIERARTSFDEVEGALSPESARVEARRCLRCDLEFTRPAPDEEPQKHGASA